MERNINKYMKLVEIFLIGIGLAMDAFAVSICKGLSMKKANWKKTCIIGIYFGIFQAGMPIVGYFLGKGFESFVTQIDHWIAFILLGFIGINMIREAFNKEKEETNDDTSFKTMVILAIATSIDALAIGITFAFLRVDIMLSACIIGIITFLISILGVFIGNKFGNKFDKKAEFLGGLILILIGIKILFEHLHM